MPEPTMLRPVEDAITRSISHNEIVILDADNEEEFDALNVQFLALEEDSVAYRSHHNYVDYSETVFTLEHWGRDDDGGDWRVHVVWVDPEREGNDEDA